VCRLSLRGRVNASPPPRRRHKGKCGGGRRVAVQWSSSARGRGRCARHAEIVDIGATNAQCGPLFEREGVYKDDADRSVQISLHRMLTIGKAQRRERKLPVAVPAGTTAVRQCVAWCITLRLRKCPELRREDRLRDSRFEGRGHRSRSGPTAPSGSRARRFLQKLHWFCCSRPRSRKTLAELRRCCAAGRPASGTTRSGCRTRAILQRTARSVRPRSRNDVQLVLDASVSACEAAPPPNAPASHCEYVVELLAW